ncbi:hypothetical protein ACWDR0_08140 [Streptomyces sp. NPDC003691]
MSTPMIFIKPELRPDLADAYDIEPIGIEDAISSAVARGESLEGKEDGVARRFLEGTGKEASDGGTGKEATDGGTGKETCDTGKEACDQLIRFRHGDVEAVRDFMRPII